MTTNGSNTKTLAPKKSTKSQLNTSFERLQALEKALGGIIADTNDAINNITSQLNVVADTLNGISNLLGADKVRAAVEEIVNKRLDDEAASQKEKLLKLVEDKKLAVAESISDASLLVLTTSNADGQRIGMRRTQVPVSSLKPEFREQIIGRGVGVSFVDPEFKNKYEVLEIYNIVDIPVPVVPDPDPVSVPDTAPESSN